ncbi:MAG: AAA family ATPase [Myxococcales bacterium]|nr:AAA family ATPase [Myxococcales bacterium]
MPDPLPPEALRWTCPPESFAFDTTDEVDPEEGIVGQSRATEALKFGLAFRAPNQHVFVRGNDGTGRKTLVKRLLEDPGVLDDTAHDRVMVLDFDQLDRPALLTLPAGRAPAFKAAVDELRAWIEDDMVEEVEAAATRESRPLQKETQAAVAALTAPFEESLAEAGLALVQVVDEDGDKDAQIMAAIDGEPVPPDALQALAAEGKIDAEQVEATLEAIEAHTDDLLDMQLGMRTLQRAHDKRIAHLVEEKARDALQAQVAPLQDAFPAAARFLDQIVAHTVDNLAMLEEDGEDLTLLYEVNVLLTRAPGQRRPVVVESAPSMRALLGTIDMPITEGTAPHMGIFAGSLLRADGGVLVLHSRSLLREEGAWEALTRTLRSREIQLLPDSQPTTLRPPGIKPAAIPIDVKVVLIGDEITWYLLDQNDPDFPNLFKILADFDEQLPVSSESLGHYAAVIATVGRKCGKAFTRDAVCTLVEQGARIAAEDGHVTTRFGRISDIAREAAWLCPSGPVTAQHVDDAIRNGKRRADGPGATFRERVKAGAIRILTRGRSVGELNGLAVISAGPLTYGMPIRITASAGPGTNGPVNVEHEALLSGQIHVKSFHIVTGLLRRLLNLPHPVAMDASIVFEQSYGGVDGDSASAASFIVLLSAVTDLPVRQDLAITGAIDQVGSVLPIGAVTEKIEGFFDCCEVEGLSGTQGVLIPASNAGDLMLRRNVVDAARNGDFSIFAVERIEEAVELFFDRPASEVLTLAREQLHTYWLATHPPT